MKFRILILVSFVLVSCSMQAQMRVDSLWGEWKNVSNPDTNRAKAILKIVETQYLFSKPDSAFYYAGIMRDFCIEKDIPQFKMQALSRMGTASYIAGKSEGAITYFDQALVIAMENGFKKGEAGECINIAQIYSIMGNREKAISYFDRSLEVSESIQDTFGIARVLGEFGIEYYFQGNIKKSAQFYQRSLKYYMLLGNKKETARMLVNLGTVYELQHENLKALQCYSKGYDAFLEVNDKHGLVTILSNMGQIYSDLGKFKKALECHYESLALAKEMASKGSISNAWKAMGETYLKMDNVDSAFATTTRAFTLKQEMKDSMGMSVTLINLGLIAKKQGNLPASLKLANQALQIAQNISLGVEIRDASKLLFEVYEITGKYREALEMHKLFVSTDDQIENEENAKEVLRSEMAYEFEKEQLVKKHEEAIEAAVLGEKTSRRNRLQYSIILIVIILAVGGVVGIGFLRVTPAIAEGLIFFAFLIFFEFLLVLADPWVDNWTNGAPGLKLLANAVIALLIFPIHHYSEYFLKKRLVKDKVKAS